ncbi:reverse transcriptase domain-containing protein [Tanacetum coccineum]
MPFFETLKNITKESNDEYQWTKDAERAFQEMKKLIIELPTLTTPILKETLYVYLATSQDAVSGVLLDKRKRNHAPIRYVSRIWMAFGGNTRDEQDYDSTPRSLKELCTVPGDGVAIPRDVVISYKRRRQNLHDGIKK